MDMYTHLCNTYFTLYTKRRSTADCLARPPTGFAADFTAVTVDTGRTQTTSGHVVTSAAILTLADAGTRRAVRALATRQKATMLKHRQLSF